LDVIPVALLRIMGKSNILPADKTRVVIYLEKDMRGSVIIVKERDVYLVREIGASASKDTFLNSILNNLRLSIDYFKRETKEVEVSDIIICTDSKVSELESFLKENITSAKIETFNITDEIEGISELGKKQTIATGLAMGSFEKQGPKVNLSDQMPGRVVNFGFNEYKPLAIEGVAVILLLALINIIGNVSLTSANKKVNEIKTQKASMVKGVGSESTGEELLNLESKLIAQFNFLGNIVGEKKVLLTNKLNILSAIMPEGAWVESLNFKDEIDKERSCAVIGVIYSQGKNETEIANKIVADMKASREFSSGFNDIKLESVGRTIAYDKDVLSFTILCSGPAVSSAGVLEEGPR